MCVLLNFFTKLIKLSLLTNYSNYFLDFHLTFFDQHWDKFEAIWIKNLEKSVSVFLAF